MATGGKVSYRRRAPLLGCTRSDTCNVPYLQLVERVTASGVAPVSKYDAADYVATTGRPLVDHGSTGLSIRSVNAAPSLDASCLRSDLRSEHHNRNLSDSPNG